ncbi:hypothetical protein DZF84_12445 [Vibrio parahaemolyticus]|nr:hypothetical protein [Vibrio parahaemolyticus]EGQ8794720.1 hypothetical protein [Vibrio parahaemolyticus]EGQ8839498.1 hypothetical protein [Vibrio parahaemolyticus]EGR1876000.1 hypothetical protein [Vibrio parahaemolyticus]EGR2221952.1 hypothetical protein [Vibrio parahaemolyticus]
MCIKQMAAESILLRFWRIFDCFDSRLGNNCMQNKGVEGHFFTRCLENFFLRNCSIELINEVHINKLVTSYSK